MHGLDILQFLLANASASAWRKTKNCIKFMLGRDTTFDETGLFLKQYVLHVTGIRRIREITCTGLRSEGAGSQAVMTMNAINFARSYGFEYVHTPFRFVQHAERPMEEWAEAWESLFNLGAGEAPCREDRSEVVDYCYHFAGLGQCFGSKWRWDELADRFRAMIPELRSKYAVNKSREKRNHVVVTVHTRRGDASTNDPGYFTNNETILQTIATVQSVLNARNVPYRIGVHSQGSAADFADFSKLGAELFLNVDAVRTMQELIESDVLVMAKGCFSYCAGLLSEGTKIFEPVPLPDPDALPSWKWRSVALAENWIVCKKDGSFDTKEFERQLILLTQAKTMAKGDNG